MSLYEYYKGNFEMPYTCSQATWFFNAVLVQNENYIYFHIEKKGTSDAESTTWAAAL